MIAEAIPPFSTVLFIFGAILFVLGLAGQISIKEATVGISGRFLRIFSAFVGAAFIAAATCLAFEIFPRPHKSSDAPFISTPAPNSDRVSIERYQELTGKWMVIEKVFPDNGHSGYEIIWDYVAVAQWGRLKMRGKKTSIENRKPSATEVKAVSDYDIALTGFVGNGTAEEKNAYNKSLRFTLSIIFSEDLKSFSGTLKSGAVEGSKITGYRQ